VPAAFARRIRPLRSRDQRAKTESNIPSSANIRRYLEERALSCTAADCLSRVWMCTRVFISRGYDFVEHSPSIKPRRAVSATERHALRSAYAAASRRDALSLIARSSSGGFAGRLRVSEPLKTKRDSARSCKQILDVSPRERERDQLFSPSDNGTRLVISFSRLQP